MLSEAFPEQGSHAPPEQGGGVTVHVYVEDVDARFERAVAAGATPTWPVQEMFWGDRFGSVEDPFGHSWSIATRVEEVSPEECEARAAAAFGRG
jgi:uncharacterized glyoxalase superfamily protein PhnB